MTMHELKLSLNTSLAILWDAVSPFQRSPAVSFSTPHEVRESTMVFTAGCAIVILHCVSYLNRLRLETFFHFFHIHFIVIIAAFHGSEAGVAAPFDCPGRVSLIAIHCAIGNVFQTFISSQLGLINHTNIAVKTLTNRTIIFIMDLLAVCPYDRHLSSA